MKNRIKSIKSVNFKNLHSSLFDAKFLVYSFSKFILLAYFLYFPVLVYKIIGYDKSARNISFL